MQATGVVYQPSISAFARMMSMDSPPVHSPSIFVAGVAAVEDQHPEFFENDKAMFAGSGWQCDSAVATAVTPARVIDGMRRATSSTSPATATLTRGIRCYRGCCSAMGSIGRRAGWRPSHPWSVAGSCYRSTRSASNRLTLNW